MIYACVRAKLLQSYLTLCDLVVYSPPGSSVEFFRQEYWNSPGKNTGVGNHSFLQGIFSTQGLNLGFLY